MKTETQNKEQGEMKTETYKVTVVETKEEREFTTLTDAKEWAELVRRTLGVWGGEPTFRCVRVTEKEVVI